MEPTLAAEVGHLSQLIPSFRLSLKAAGRSPRTLKIYLIAAESFVRFLEDRGMPRAADAIKREHVEAFIAELLETKAPNTAATYYRSLRVFFAYLLEEGEISSSPMERMKPPKVPEVPVPIVRTDELKRLIAACEGKDFEARRDMAIVRLLYDSMMRCGELAGLKVSDVDLEHGEAVVTGKGGRQRRCLFGSKTALAIDRYLRARARHPLANLDDLWLAKRGPLQDGGVQRMIRRRGDQAGIDHLHPHRLRHTGASDWLDAGESENHLMKVAGWRSRTMVDRYGAAVAEQRAQKAHRRLALGDRL